MEIKTRKKIILVGDKVLIAPRASQDEVRSQASARAIGGALAWPACLRKLDRDLPGYDA